MNNLILSRINNIQSYDNLSSISDLSISLNTDTFDFINVPGDISYTQAYEVEKSSTAETYTLYFTELPIIQLDIPDNIPVNDKVPGIFTYADDHQVLISDFGIELRGATSLFFPKLSYDMEFWEDPTGDDNKDVQFGNMRDDDDWILDALYNEPLRMRSFLANKLWLDLHTPHYIADEPEAKAGSDVMFVEVFLRGQYNGVYNLQEQVDRKQLEIKDFNGNMRGELFKAEITNNATTYTDLPPIDNTVRTWSGYEKKHPDEDELTEWSNLYDFTNFVMNSSPTDFENDIWNQFNQDNFNDYFIFVNLLRGTDNTGKNVYMARYDVGEPYFWAPWDLDGTFGLKWDGTYENITDDILTNGFFTRVTNENPGNATIAAANRWNFLRNNILDSVELTNSMTNLYNEFTAKKIYEREALIYPNYQFDQQALDYVINWTNARLIFLDDYFNQVLSSSSQLRTVNEIIAYPNPVKNILLINDAKNLLGEDFQIYNKMGQQVLDGSVSTNGIDFSNLNSGNYILKIDNYTTQIIKQ
ncbi:MAG: CotH kinase family protein [Nonlabens sp.]